MQLYNEGDAGSKEHTRVYVVQAPFRTDILLIFVRTVRLVATYMACECERDTRVFIRAYMYIYMYVCMAVFNR